MEKCGYRSVIACSIRGFFCSMDVNLTMPRLRQCGVISRGTVNLAGFAALARTDRGEYSGGMRTSARTRYAGYRFPAEIIGHAVWLYFRFPLGLRMVEELLAARGIIVSHETVRLCEAAGWHRQLVRSG